MAMHDRARYAIELDKTDQKWWYDVICPRSKLLSKIKYYYMG